MTAPVHAQDSTNTGVLAAWSFTPTAGNVLILIVAHRDGYQGPTTPAGWTLLALAGAPSPSGFDDAVGIFGKVSDGTETQAAAHLGAGSRSWVSEWAGVTLTGHDTDAAAGTGTAAAMGTVAPDAGGQVIGVAVANGDSSASFTPATGYTELVDDDNGGGHPHTTIVYRTVTTAGTYSPAATISVSRGWHGLALILPAGTVDPGPDPGEEPGPEVILPTPPAAAILEIYVREENAYRWGIATWGEPSAWSTAGWVNVTPQGMWATVTWGVDRPDAGILADTVPGNWSIRTHDPERKLDPSNPDSVYAPEIVPGLPVRLSHRTHVIRTGILERASYEFADKGGELRVTDDISRMATAAVPEDTLLPGTLRARARAAIAAAGLDVQVEPNPPGADPVLSDAPVGEYSAWQVIVWAARETFHVPWLDANRIVRFGRWFHPMRRGATIASDRLVDLEVSISDEALVSVVRAEDPDDGPVERRITPLPRYGERVHERSGLTLDASNWAEKVLLDRSAAALRYSPGRVFLDTADDVDEMIRRQTNEVIGIELVEQTPDVEVLARILGARVRVEHFGIRNAPTWEWYFATTVAAAKPLVFDGGPPSIVAVSDADGVTELYADGVVSL